MDPVDEEQRIAWCREGAWRATGSFTTLQRAASPHGMRTLGRLQDAEDASKKPLRLFRGSAGSGAGRVSAPISSRFPQHVHDTIRKRKPDGGFGQPGRRGPQRSRFARVEPRIRPGRGPVSPRDEGLLPPFRWRISRKRPPRFWPSASGRSKHGPPGAKEAPAWLASQAKEKHLIRNKANASTPASMR